VFTFQCTRCRRKPAIITRGRRVFLCADCATGSLWYDMVGSLMDPNAPAETPTTVVPALTEEEGPEPDWAEGPIDPWAATA
jgi:hypothetical protein